MFKRTNLFFLSGVFIKETFVYKEGKKRKLESSIVLKYAIIEMILSGILSIRRFRLTHLWPTYISIVKYGTFHINSFDIKKRSI
jgi:hypothetical protein